MISPSSLIWNMTFLLETCQKRNVPFLPQDESLFQQFPTNRWFSGSGQSPYASSDDRSERSFWSKSCIWKASRPYEFLRGQPTLAWWKRISDIVGICGGKYLSVFFSWKQKESNRNIQKVSRARSAFCCRTCDLSEWTESRKTSRRPSRDGFSLRYEQPGGLAAVGEWQTVFHKNYTDRAFLLKFITPNSIFQLSVR